MIQPSTLKFLEELKLNNNKPWFDAHRKEYEAARENFAGFINELIREFGKYEPSIMHLTAKDCMFRINRDVRFSKDKSPYKTNFGASINAEGKKSMKAGYYFHLSPGESFIGGGLWHPLPADLNKLRQEIDYNLPEFQKILSAKKFKTTYSGLYAEEGQLLSRVPKGYEPDNPAAAYLKYKSYTALSDIPDAEILSKSLPGNSIKAFQALQPLIIFINKGIDE
ncbi:TIGR02453 family protein [Niabella ginsenosidivorans]|uniref:TIGR02453 family protein n=1 Tax=Niabella ginsenosidivorans TaxID=1176587 RepID=A0A1A9I736_9BACT|nr:DUF2461 domain-containing protein [Niabella ginsenosidivorans]ANH82869.1 TIGR02453 family protein [Niabella ginsenosidivorans]